MLVSLTSAVCQLYQGEDLFPGPHIHHVYPVCIASDEDSNLATPPMPDIDSDSMMVPVDEEERWLEALEKGELDDNGELKKEVDESLLTARQVRRRETELSSPVSQNMLSGGTRNTRVSFRHSSWIFVTECMWLYTSGRLCNELGSYSTGGGSNKGLLKVNDGVKATDFHPNDILRASRQR